ncbi:SDR family oxidoreductase [Amycolatopsis sp. OK19-0408]|uniref:SDR family oxidoreductase n=1 Tax=Amycolatopsis iheyensis TaxID=2945988 RepID=A0A9X2N7V4_9PSEU|nr:SDR family NAD(P)-dependent oxidoreductase [Amycolatopsis iheyensis]MCR6482862.1 SDR family oxidoreductase [Amycolatopsis iheyensis]
MTTGDVRGRVAVVTGGGGGIGAAVCEDLAAQGARVAVVDRDEDAAAAVVKQLRDQDAEAEAFVCRLDDSAAVTRMAGEVVERFAGLDILCNVAGSVRRGSVLELSDDDWHACLADNLTSVFLTCRLAIPHMTRAGGGAIVNVASGWGLRGGAAAAAYCAAKGGVVQLTRAMALDHAPLVRVNCVAPGDVRTPLLEDEARQVGVGYREFLREAGDRPLLRVGTPAEIAAVIGFLAGPRSSFMTGAVVAVDGGGTV